MAMKIAAPPKVVAVVTVIPDEIQFDCPACDVTHLLMRGLDFIEGPDGVWRVVEDGGFECDCGVLLQADFTLMPVSPKAPT